MSTTRIKTVHARRVWDSRGRPTLETEIGLEEGSSARAIAPAGASRGSREAIDLRDGGKRLGGFDVGRAIAAVNGPIAAAIKGLDAADQGSIDRALLALDPSPTKSQLGGNALIATSMAVAHAVAAATGEPWPSDRYPGSDGRRTIGTQCC
jgi:enolase